MHRPYVRKTKEPRRHKLELTPGFRVIRGFPMEWNADRLLRHLKREMREADRSTEGRRFRIKMRATGRAARAARAAA